MRNRRDIDDGVDFQTDGLEGADGAVAAKAGTGDLDHNVLEAVRHGVAGGVLSNDLGGVTAVYDYEVGNEPSAGRAIGHGVADLLTLGAWELVGTPVEAVQGDKYRLTIAYDKDNKAKTISSQKI